MDSDRTINPQAPWWRQSGFYVLILMVLGVYFTRIETMPFGRDEPRWARVAAEMVETGDWVVPRQQGNPFVDRPPLSSYILLLLAGITGEMDIFTIRLPSITAILLMSIVAYIYASRFLTPLGAFAAAVAFPTFGQVYPQGQVGENDAVLTLLIGSSLLLWHYGWAHGWPRSLTWIVGYSLAALGALQKGLQAPCYFGAAVVVYLVISRQWRKLFTLSHLAGIAVFVVIVAAWWVPFYLRTDFDTAVGVWLRVARYRYRGTGLLRHVLTFPPEMWACLLPWSGLAVGLIFRVNRRRLRPVPDPIIFVLTAMAVAVPSVWFSSIGSNRYLMPVFPCAAVVLGWLLERFATAPPASEPRKAWDRFLAALGLVILAGGSVILVASLWPAEPSVEFLAQIAQPRAFAAAFMAAAAVGSAGLFVLRRRYSAAAAGCAVAVIAGSVGLAFTGAYLNAVSRVNNDISQEVADIRARLPHPERLESFGPVDHRFNYYYKDLIRERPWPTAENNAAEGLEYFCFDRYVTDTPETKLLSRGMYRRLVPNEFPFEWETIEEVAVNRMRTANPETRVVIGRIIRSGTAPEPTTSRRD